MLVAANSPFSSFSPTENIHISSQSNLEEIIEQSQLREEGGKRGKNCLFSLFCIVIDDSLGRKRGLKKKKKG